MTALVSRSRIIVLFLVPALSDRVQVHYHRQVSRALVGSAASFGPAKKRKTTRETLPAAALHRDGRVAELVEGNTPQPYVERLADHVLTLCRYAAVATPLAQHLVRLWVATGLRSPRITPPLNS
jgi:hypothetical protein